MKKGLITKVGRGIHTGDVANTSTRNILTILSEELFGKITEKDLQETAEYFDWKCPYTGKDIKAAIENGTCVLDHIVPQNQDECGLNVKGNLILVDKDANAAKGKKSADTFLMTDQKILAGVDNTTRMERLKKIQAFQIHCDYNPSAIKKVLSDKLKEIYKETQDRQLTIAGELDEFVRNSVPSIGKHPEIDVTTCTDKKCTSKVDIKISVLVKSAMYDILQSGNVSDEEIASLCDKSYSKKTLHLNYPLLVKFTEERDRNRYYAKPISINGISYYVCNDWYENSKNNDRPYLERWLDVHQK